jgi:hypothetical protein
MEAGAHQRIERLVLNLHAVRPPHPLAERLIGGEAFRAAERLLKAGQYLGGQRDAFAGGDVCLQQGLQASGRVEGQPAANRVPMDARQVGQLLTGVGLATGQQVEHLKAGPLVPVTLTLEPLFKIIRMVGNGGYRRAHSLSSRSGASQRLRRVTPLCTMFNDNSYYLAPALAPRSRCFLYSEVPQSAVVAMRRHARDSLVLEVLLAVERPEKAISPCLLEA